MRRPPPPPLRVAIPPPPPWESDWAKAVGSVAWGPGCAQATMAAWYCGPRHEWISRQNAMLNDLWVPQCACNAGEREARMETQVHRGMPSPDRFVCTHGGVIGERRFCEES